MICLSSSLFVISNYLALKFNPQHFAHRGATNGARNPERVGNVIKIVNYLLPASDEFVDRRFHHEPENVQPIFNWAVTEDANKRCMQSGVEFFQIGLERSY